MSPLSDRDFKLSMRVSRKGNKYEDGSKLRNLLVHRLRFARKAVLRIPLKKNLATAGINTYSVHCEPCGK